VHPRPAAAHKNSIVFRRHTCCWCSSFSHCIVLTCHLSNALFIVQVGTFRASALWKNGPVVLVLLRRPGCGECKLCHGRMDACAHGCVGLWVCREVLGWGLVGLMLYVVRNTCSDHPVTHSCCFVARRMNILALQHRRVGHRAQAACAESSCCCCFCC